MTDKEIQEQLMLAVGEIAQKLDGLPFAIIAVRPNPGGGFDWHTGGNSWVMDMISNAMQALKEKSEMSKS